MRMPKVSVIVPVYKAEAYLARCVDSIRSQTLQDLEIILVDDGSPDSCPQLCDAYAQEDPRIRVVHKENGGLSSARNTGMAVATGQYWGFVDSDDAVEPEMFQTLYETAALEQVDFVMADYIRVPTAGKPYLKTFSIAPGRYERQKIVTDIFPQLIMGHDLDYGPLLSVCQCLYRAEFLAHNHLAFDEQVRWSEDNIFSAQVGYLAGSFFYLKGRGFYRYYENPGTITTSYRKGAWDVYCTMHRHLHSFFDGAADYDFSGQLQLHLLYYACNSLGQIPASGEGKQTQLEMIKAIMGDPQLQKTMQNFAIPGDWPMGLRIQTALIKFGLAKLYQLLVLR